MCVYVLSLSEDGGVIQGLGLLQEIAPVKSGMSPWALLQKGRIVVKR